MTRRTVLGAMMAGSAWARKAGNALLLARPAVGAPSVAGLHGMGIRKNRDAQLYVPLAVAESGKPAPFLVYLHGAGGSPEQGIRRLRELADATGFVLLSPGSEGRTWDAIRDSYGPDVRALDEALEKAFDRCRVEHVGVCGFSDGASYALGLGLANGDLFRSVMAFSPGFVPAGFAAQGKPRVFVSHGTRDEILPIETCSRRLVPDLKGRGYAVTYREFEGPHTVPRDVSEEAMRWFVGSVL